MVEPYQVTLLKKRVDSLEEQVKHLEGQMALLLARLFPDPLTYGRISPNSKDYCVEEEG